MTQWTNRETKTNKQPKGLTFVLLLFAKIILMLPKTSDITLCVFNSNCLLAALKRKMQLLCLGLQSTLQMKVMGKTVCLRQVHRWFS